MLVLLLFLNLCSPSRGRFQNEGATWWCHLVVTSIFVSQNIIWNTELWSTEADFRKLLRISYFKLHFCFTERRDGLVWQGDRRDMLLHWPYFPLYRSGNATRDDTGVLNTSFPELCTHCWRCQCTKNRGTLKDSSSCIPKWLHGETTEREVKWKCESLMKIFYNHKIT